MSLYDTVADLALTIEAYELDALQQQVSGDFVRHTTIVHLQGKSALGMGEDVTYAEPDQLSFQKHGPTLDIVGLYTVESFSRKLDTLTLFDTPPQQEAFHNYRRWAFESAALSLALRQANTTLAKLLDRTLQPVTFVNSMRFDNPASSKPLKDRLVQYPKLRFKLDPTSDWNEELIAELAATNAVDTIDLKGHYKGTPVDTDTDPALYQKLVNAFPEAWIEDPDINDETRAILKPHADRITWDAPIHSIADIENMEFAPAKMINIKPSRFGSVKELFDTYEYCVAHNIRMYGGGQFELGIGRTQIQYLAALFHPHTPNDVAPKGYNAVQLSDDLPVGPITVSEF